MLDKALRGRFRPAPSLLNDPLEGPGSIPAKDQKEDIMRRILVLAQTLGLLACLASPGVAQETATIQATATVISGLTVTGGNDLIFGIVIPGTPKAVDRTDVGFAGSWGIAGTTNAEVALTITLPDSLQHETVAVGFPITFTNSDASYEDGTGGGQTAPAGTIDPNNPYTVRLGTAGSLQIWIGGTVFPSVTQTGGDYASDIMLSVIYTGS